MAVPKMRRQERRKTRVRGRPEVRTGGMLLADQGRGANPGEIREERAQREEEPMRSLTKALAVFSLLAVSASLGWAATITGTVKGPDGAAFKGAFVEATNSGTRMTYAVLSHRDGKYALEN